MNTSFEVSKEKTTTTWLTPPEILNSLGEFDLDPCAPLNRPWDMAKRHYTIMENGLLQPWEGRVWLNPPYGKEMPAFLKKMALHGNGIALTFNRSETKVFHEWVFPYAKAILFKEGRIHFLNNEGIKVGNGSGTGSLFIAYSDYDVEMLRISGVKGKLILIN